MKENAVSLKEELSAGMKDAMKAKDAARLGCLRLVVAALKNREIAKRGELDDADCIKVLSQLAKQRRESIEMFEKGGRQELVKKEKAELVIIESFLPEPFSEEELSKLIAEAIAEVGAEGPRDMGKVMKVVSPRVAGRADGRRVSDAVKSKLAEKQA